MMRAFLTSSLFVVTVFTGCFAPIGTLSTPSGKPEITIKDRTRSGVIDAIAVWSSTKGFTPLNKTDFGIITKGTAQVTRAMFVTPNAPATNNYTVVQSKSSVVVYVVQFLTYPQDAYGYYSNMVGSRVLTTENNAQEGYEKLQNELRELKEFIEQNVPETKPTESGSKS